MCFCCSNIEDVHLIFDEAWMELRGVEKLYLPATLQLILGRCTSIHPPLREYDFRQPGRLKLTDFERCFFSDVAKFELSGLRSYKWHHVPWWQLIPPKSYCSCFVASCARVHVWNARSPSRFRHSTAMQWGFFLMELCFIYAAVEMRTWPPKERNSEQLEAW